MSASESSPFASNLQESIEQLISETVRQSQSTHEEEKQKLQTALRTALADIELGQESLNRAAATLRAALEEPTPTPAISEIIEPEVEIAPAEIAIVSDSEPVIASPAAGPHELDVIGHDVSIGIATSLQSMLRDRPEVDSAQTREFVNGELRLKLALNAGLDMTALTEWLAIHSGRVTTHTKSVLELRFGD